MNSICITFEVLVIECVETHTIIFEVTVYMIPLADSIGGNIIYDVWNLVQMTLI